jgi:hypothetical protein
MANDNIVSILLQILGGQQAAADVSQVSEKMQGLKEAVKQAMDTGIAADVAMAQKQVQLERTAGATKQATESNQALKQSLQNMSETMIEKVTPSLDDGVKQLLKIAAAAFTVREAWNGVSEALEFGARAQQLSFREGDTVQNIVVLEQSFKNAGLGAQFLATAFQYLDRALAPIGPESKKNMEVFREMGLSVAELRRMNLADQIQAISEGMERLPDQAARIAASVTLFGRSGSQIMQLFGDPGAMALAREQAERMGDVMQRNAKTFNDVEKSLNGMKLQIMEMWVATTTQLVPAFQQFASLVKGVSLAPIGSAIPSIATAFGLVMSTALVARLDTAVLNWAEGTGAGALFAKNFIAPLTGGLTSLMTTVLPVLLGAAIAAGLVLAITQIQLDSINDVDRTRDAGARRVHAASQSIATASQDNLPARRDAIIAQIAEESTAIAPIQARKDELDAYNTKYGRTGQPNEAKLPAEEQAQYETHLRTIQGLLAVLNATPAPAVLDKNKLAETNREYVTTLATLDELKKKTDELNQKVEDHQTQKRNALAEIDRLEKQRSTDGVGLNATQKEQADAGIALAIAQQRKIVAEAEKGITEEKNKQLRLDEQGAQQLKTRMSTDLDLKIRETQASGDTTLLRQLEVSQLEAKLVAQGASNAQIERETALLRGQWSEQDRLKGITREREAANDALKKVQLEEAAIQSSLYKTNDEKWPLLKANLEKQIDLNNQLIAQLKAARDAAQARGDVAHADQLTTQLHGAEDTGIGLQGKVGNLGPGPTDFGSNLVKNMVSVRNQMETLAQGLASTVGSTFTSMNAGLTNAFNGWLNHTKSLRQGFGEMALGMVQSMDQALAKMAADWVLKHAVMDNVRRLFLAMGMTEERAAALFGVSTHTAAEVSKTAATGAGVESRGALRVSETIFHGIQVAAQLAVHVAAEIAKTTIAIAQWAIRLPILIAESVIRIALAAISAAQSVAAVPYIGPFLAVAAAAGMVALGAKLISGKGLKSGGFTGHGSDDEEGPQTHRNEFVFSAPAVRAIGLGNLQDMHAAAVSGGGSGGSAAGSQQTAGRAGKTRDGSKINLAFFGKQNDASSWLKSRDGSREMIDFMRQNRYQLQ